MKRKFTFLIAAAVMLLTMMATTGEMWGQTYTWNETAITDLATGDYVVIVGSVTTNNTTSTYAMSNDKGTGNPPAATAVTVSNGQLSGTIGDAIQWVITITTTTNNNVTTTSYKFGKPATTISDYLYCTNSNNGVRVGTNNNNSFTYISGGTANNVTQANYLYNTGTSRYVGIYNKQDWRCYTTTPASGNNIANQSFAFYKRVEVQTEDPYITADDVEIAYNATEGSIAYTVNNAVTGGTISASVTDGNWLTLGNGTASPISFTCSANEENTARTSTIRLTYTYNTNETVTKDVTVTQAAAPVIYTTISDIFDAATTTETSVNVTFNNWVVSGVSTNGKNVYVTDGTNGLIIFYTSNMSATFSAGQILSGENVSCTLKLYNGAAELLNVDAGDLTITTGGTVTPADIEMANLAGVNTGALLHYDGLTCTINNNKYYLTDGTTSLQLYNALFAFSNPVAGKVYNITGVYVQYNNTKEIMPRSADDIEVVETEVADPVFSPTAGTYATTQTVTMSCTTEGAAIHYTTNGTEPDGNSTQYTEPISVSTTTTFKAKAIKGDDASAVITATYHICSAENPYTVAQALAFHEYPTSTIWVHGIVSTAPTAAPNNGQLTYYISDNGEATNQLQIYKGKGLNEASFTAQDDIQVGDIVTVTGIVKIYNNTTEIDAGNYLTSFERPTPPVIPTITVNPTLVEATAVETEGSLTVTYTAIETDLGVEIHWFETTTSTEPLSAAPEWIDADFSTTSIETIDYVIAANTGAARTAYFKVYGLDTNGDDVYSDLVTINQAAGTTPPTPGQYDWVLTDLANLTANDVFVIVGDNGDTYAMENDNGTSAPAAVSVTIANGAISSTVADNIQWNLSTSDDGYMFYPNGTTETWLYCTNTNNGVKVGTGDAKHFTLDDTFGYLTTTETTDQRYIGIYSSQDWRCYKLDNNQIHSNIAGQTFAFYKRVPASTEPSITLNKYTYNLNADGGDAELPVTTANLATTPNLAVVFYESDGTTTTTYDWISATINGNGNIAGHINENEGAARTAYFKVSGLANDNTTTVYSDLVTINQAAATAPSIVFETASMDLEAGGEQDRKLSFDYAGLGSTPTFTINYYESDGTTATIAATYSWLTATIEGDKLNIKAVANTGEARSAYLKVYGEKNANVHAESNLVTINQAAYVAPTYTVTYNANGGTGTMTDPNSPYIENTEVTLLENTFTAPEGKIWNSWLVKDANQTTIAVNNNTFTMPASNVTVTAQWVDNPVVPTYEWVLTALEDLTANDVFVIVGTRDNTNYYGMSTDKGTSTQPEAVEVTIANNKLSASPADRIKWNLTGDNSTGYIFYPNGSSTTWLYCNTTAASGSNTNMRVGTGDRKLFVLDNDNYLVTNDENTARYVSLNGSTDWRGYVNTNQATTITFYKRQVASTDPQLSANDVNIASDATEGEITYTLANPVQGGQLLAEITAGNEGNWLTLGNVGETTVSFTCEANTEQTERTATITLTYTYDAKTSITATAVVTQAALIIDYATMPFAYDGNGTGTLPNGLTATGLGTYSSSPKMKFDGADDNLILKLNAAPVSIIYDIKGNGSGQTPWAGKFKVQVSADGTEYEDLKVYENNLGDVQTDTIINNITNNTDVRYIKWIYTEKTTGNVALGNIQVYDVEFTIINNSTTIPDLTIGDGEAIVVNTDVVLELTGTVTNPDPANLIIREGGQLVTESDVQATLQKEVTKYSAKSGDGWYLIASPVEPLAASVVAQGTYDLFTYDEEHAYWYSNTGATAPFTELHRGQGYLYANADNINLNYAGTMKATNSNINVELSYTSSLSTDVRGFNLMGNPFTRNIKLGDMELDGTTLTQFYVMNAARTGLQSIDNASYEIKPGEGFFVQATAENQQLTFKPTSKGLEDIKFIKIVAGNENGTDNAYINLSCGNTLRKMNIANLTSVYVMDGDDDYAAARVEELAGTMPIHFEAVSDGEYTITIEAKYTDAHYMHLLDNFTGADIDLLVEPSYTFNATTNDNADRFRLVFDCNNYTGVEENYTGEIFAYQNGNDIYVNGNGELQVFDVMGRMVATQHINGVEAVNVKLQGVYIFRLNGNTQKIVVK